MGFEAADPVNATAYRARAAQYDRRLADLDGRIRREIATIPVERRRAVTGHASFRYFTRAYGVRFDAPRGQSTGSEPTAPVLVAEIARDSDAVIAHRSIATRATRRPGPAARRRPTTR